MLRVSPILLDANVLAESAVSDLILRLANGPKLFSLAWTHEIWNETRRTMLQKLLWPENIVDSRISAAKLTFPEAMVSGYEHLLPFCSNDPKDRHLLATAIHAGIPRIVTMNTKHFSVADLKKWNVQAIHPDTILVETFQLSADLVIQTVNDMAHVRAKPLSKILSRLSAPLPKFATKVGSAISCEFQNYDSKTYRQ